MFLSPQDVPFPNVTLKTHPVRVEGILESVQLEEMYSALRMISMRRTGSAFLKFFVGDVINLEMARDVEMNNFMSYFHNAKSSYGHDITKNTSDLLEILGGSKTTRYDEHMVDTIVDAWVTNTKKFLMSSYERFRSDVEGRIDMARGFGLSEEHIDAYGIIGFCVSKVWRTQFVQLPSLDSIVKTLKVHIELIMRFIHKVEWYIRRKFLTLQWSEDPRVPNWETAKLYAKAQQEEEERLTHLPRSVAREEVLREIEGMLTEQSEGSEEFMIEEFRLTGTRIGSAFKKKKKNVPRRRKEEEEERFLFQW